jgi:hypothetical protein
MGLMVRISQDNIKHVYTKPFRRGPGYYKVKNSLSVVELKLHLMKFQ